MNFQCNKDDDILISACDSVVLADNSAYQSAESSFYNLASAEINEDCLNVNISSSGFDSSTWVLTLIDSGDIAES